MAFTLTLSAASTSTIEVRYSIEDGTAKAAEDYVATSDVVTFAPGETTIVIWVVIKTDQKKESDEYFQVLLEPVLSVELADGIGRGVIQNRR
jgi:chitinase